MKISIVINADTRPERFNDDGLGKGVISRDFLVEGVLNRKQFFNGFEIETIIYIDKHEEIPKEEMDWLVNNCDAVVVRKHRNIPSSNDWNYQEALFMASGDIIAHFDQDTVCFTSGKEAVQELIDFLQTYKYVSYPSWWSPNAVDDPSFNYRWASTRFFMCKRETIDFTELRKCILNYDYFVERYKPSRVCPWTEHALGLMAESSVYYPEINHDKLSIFTWGSYYRYLLRRLNGLSYQEIKEWLSTRPIQYPVDIHP